MIIGFTGDMGSGKTLSLIRYAIAYQKEGYNIYSNIKLRTVKYKTYTFHDLLHYAESKELFKNSIFILDEAHIYIDSRTSAMKRNRIISYFLLQTRKKDVLLLYTTQYAHQVDKRLRSATEIVVQCSTKKVNGESWTLNKMNMFRSNGAVIKKNVIFKSKDFYKYYDTTEVVMNMDEDS